MGQKISDVNKNNRGSCKLPGKATNLPDRQKMKKWNMEVGVERHDEVDMLGNV